ncbi:MAG: hypothetical protein KAY96_00885, partial [Bacteroidia bacterium]|nr:hypothetical protein [Bacteroidia bacterium]
GWQRSIDHTKRTGVANPITMRCLGWQRAIDHIKETGVANPITTRYLGWQRSTDHIKQTGVANPITTRCLGWQRSTDRIHCEQSIETAKGPPAADDGYGVDVSVCDAKKNCIAVILRSRTFGG